MKKQTSENNDWHTLDNKERDLWTYFIKKCIPKPIAEEQSSNLSGFQIIFNLIVDSLNKISREKRTKQSIEKILLDPNFKSFQKILEKLKVNTTSLTRNMELDIPSAQDSVRSLISDLYSETSEKLWSEYPSTKNNPEKMKNYIDWTMRNLNWEISQEQNQRRIFVREIANRHRRGRNQISEELQTQIKQVNETLIQIQGQSTEQMLLEMNLISSSQSSQSPLSNTFPDEPDDFGKWNPFKNEDSPLTKILQSVWFSHFNESEEEGVLKPQI